MRFQSAVLILGVTLGLIEVTAGGAMAQEAPKSDPAPGIKATDLGAPVRRVEIIMSKGDNVIAGLTEWAQKNNVKMADFTAVGAFGKATLGWFDPEKRKFKEFPFNEEMEIASLTGNIRPDRNGKPNVHVHCVTTTGDGIAHAGHLVEGTISLTLQLYMNVEEPPQASASK